MIDIHSYLLAKANISPTAIMAAGIEITTNDAGNPSLPFNKMLQRPHTLHQNPSPCTVLIRIVVNSAGRSLPLVVERIACSVLATCVGAGHESLRIGIHVAIRSAGKRL